MNGNPSGADTIMSQAIDLGNISGVLISYYFEQTGGGEPPDAGDDLFVEYYNQSEQWVLLKQHLGADASMSSYQLVTMGVPVDGYHSAFRLRFRCLATVGVSDDWFVDDVKLDFGPAILATPGSYAKTVAQGDSTFDKLVVANTGQGSLDYSLAVIPDLTPKLTLFENLRQAGRVNPATYDWPAYEAVKGEESVRLGPKVLFDAGGPDAFGYVWIDSDEPGGPTFNWVDIELTGTDITVGLADDNFVGPFPIGFTFPYYDSNYTQFYVASNGFIGFGPTTGYNSLSNGVLPSSSTPNNIICWCWNDLNILDSDNPGGKVLMQNVGGDLVIQFENYPEYDFAATPGNVITAEVILLPDGTIKLQYESTVGFDSLGNTVGVENKNGTIGLTMVVDAAYIHSGLAVEITKPAQWLSYDVASGSVPPGSSDTVQLKFSAVDLDTGYYGAQIKVSSNDPDAGDNPLVIPATLTVITPYIFGDANGDLIVNITDVVYILTYVFNSGPAPNPLAAGDANCDGLVNISDIVYLIQYIFNSGPAPCA